MVSHTRTTADTRRIRRLKTPGTVEVQSTADGLPTRLRLGGVWRDVSLVRRPWRIDQHWWRGEPIKRDYYRIAPEDGPALTIYRDRLSGGWSRQEY
jgi:hypothetical protein